MKTRFWIAMGMVSVILWANLFGQEAGQGETYTITPQDDYRFELQDRLINAVPGDVIQLEAGFYSFLSELNVVENNITIRGRGHETTILSFESQESGSEGIMATGDAFVIENLAVEDSVGNAIKVFGSKGVIFRGVRVDWTNGPDSNNGAYGIYPIQCSDVLIEDCIARHASDAGIYVGQSRNVVVRRNLAERNVAGIEIENTVGADVYDNVAINNTGGILVFDLPGLELVNGGDIRIFNNRVVDNNTPNFATKGTMVAGVPTGTGLMVMATDRVEIFGNEIENNDTTGISLVSYYSAGRKFKDAGYDPFPEGINIHDNTYRGGGTNPVGEVPKLVLPYLGKPFPHIFYDGILNPKRSDKAKLPVLVIDERPGTTFGNVNLGMLNEKNVANGKYKIFRDISAHAGTAPSSAAIVLPPMAEPLPSLNDAAHVYRSAPRLLSDWGMFETPMSRHVAADGVFPYELNSPLFSDYTIKRRFIRLPAGEQMDYHAKTVFDFPVGTAIAKTFSYPHDMRDPELGERHLETRIEFRNEAGWFGYSYIWNDEQSEAELALSGGSIEVSWIHDDGDQRSLRYAVPNANQCISCHSHRGDFRPIGLTARNLNRVGLSGDQNQLRLWQEMGILKGLEKDVPYMAAYEDLHDGTINDRARAWLDVNCAHCHQRGGSAKSTGLYLDFGESREEKLGVWKSPVATGRGSGGRKYDIVPGHPDKSILIHRIESSEPGVRMPSLARSIPHDEGVELIRAWIMGMKQEEEK